jgi:hypothetical protein
MTNAKSGRKKRSVTWKRVAGPDLCCVIAQESRPLLSLWLWWANPPYILLDGPLTHMNAQFQKFPTNPLGTEDGDSSSPSP